MNIRTPGPWTIDACLDAAGHSTIRRCDGSPHGDTALQPIATVYKEADARLIVAAPEMYKAIETALRHHDEAVALLERAADQLQEDVDRDMNSPIAMEIYAFLRKVKNQVSPTPESNRN